MTKNVYVPTSGTLVSIPETLLSYSVNVLPSGERVRKEAAGDRTLVKPTHGPDAVVSVVNAAKDDRS